MTKRLGVWIDREKAYLVGLDDAAAPSVTCIESKVESRKKPRGGQRGVGGEEQGHGDHRRQAQLNHFYEQVLERMKGVEQIRLFGPGSTRMHLETLMMERHDLAEHLDGTETADSMTEPQLVALVREAFGVTPRRRSQR